LLFEDPTFEVVRATLHAEDGLVKVRWKISGNYQAPLKFFKGSKGYFDGISYYYVAGSSGLVSVHTVDYQTPVMPPNYAGEISWREAWSGLVVPAGVPARPIPATAVQAPPPLAARTSTPGEGDDGPKAPRSGPRAPPVVAGEVAVNSVSQFVTRNDELKN
jgi:hypothetical protein